MRLDPFVFSCWAATLHVIGVPIADIIPDAFDYGTRYAGYSHLTNFRVVNTGTDVLNVSEVITTDPTLVIGELQTGGEQVTQILAGFSLAPGQGRLFTLAWQPVDEVTLAAQVVVHSDDPVNPTVTMAVTGNSIFPPITTWSPASFSENLLVGDVVNRTLHVENHGGSDLNYTVAVLEIGAESVTVHPDVKVGKGEELPGPGILGSGGPDMLATSGSIPTKRADRSSTGSTSPVSEHRSIWDRHRPTTTTPARSTWA